MREQHLF